MWHQKLIVEYIDGEVIESSTKEWEKIRPEGINSINLKGRTHLSGDSIYFIYPDTILDNEIVWMVGSFAVYMNTCTEFMIRQNGEVIGRERRSMPDLKHDQVKLGWWRKED